MTKIIPKSKKKNSVHKKHKISKQKKVINNTIKNLTVKHIFICVILFVIGFGIGIGTFLGICKNDCFELIGKKEITIYLNDSYIDEGVKIIEFGKDASSSVYIETNLQNNNNEFYALDAGLYYIKYLSSSIKFGKIFKISKIRLITVVVEESEGGE